MHTLIWSGAPLLSRWTSLLAPRSLRRTGVTRYPAPSTTFRAKRRGYRLAKVSKSGAGVCSDFPPSPRFSVCFTGFVIQPNRDANHESGAGRSSDADTLYHTCNYCKSGGNTSTGMKAVSPASILKVSAVNAGTSSTKRAGSGLEKTLG